MKKIVALILILVMSLPTVSCAGKNEEKAYKEYSFDWFDTVTTITGYEKDKKDFDKAIAEVKAVFDKYHRLYNIYLKYEGINNLAVVNSKVNGEHTVVKVEKEIIDLIKYSREMYNVTNGKFNIAMGSVLSIWHTYRTLGMDEEEIAQLPPMSSLQDASNHTDINDVVIDEENLTVFLKDPKLTLDVGAIAKGYACEAAARRLEELGYDGYVINAGGNIRTIGTKPNGEKWLVGIENPDREDEDRPYLAYLELDGQALVTSGSYQRFYIVDGVSYHHIIDPETLMPATRYLSVSVLCNDSGLADALSTALFNMSVEDGKAVIEKLEGVEVHWVLNSGEIITTDGFDKFRAKNH